jgi:trans-aconitate methyltransferase
MDLIEFRNRNDYFIARHPWELARFEVLASLLKPIIQNKETFNVIDIGCGDLFFIFKLSQRYPKVNFYGIDTAFNDEIISELKDITKKENIYLFKTLDEANLHLKKSPDLILLLDVIEHIQDDIGFLNSLSNNKAIGNKTFIAITVPAFQSLFSSHDHLLGHYRRYTNKTLSTAIRKANFEELNMGYFFFSLTIIRIIQFIKEKISKPDLIKKNTDLVDWNKGLHTTNFIKYILILDFRIYKFIKALTGLSLIGLSNYVICKKRV